MKFHKEVLNDVWMQFIVLCLLMALSVDSLKCVSLFLVRDLYDGIRFA